MPDPDRLLKTLRQAAHLFRTTPGCNGHLVRLEEAAEVLVSGDLHGHLENFRQLLQRADLGRQPRRHLVLQELVHGPFRYPLGGDKSHQLVDLVAALKCQYPRQVHLLLGNHELAEMTGQRIAKGTDQLNDLFRQGLETAYGSRADEIFGAYLELFAALPLAVRTANRIFLSHSLPASRHLPAFDPAILERQEFDDGDLRPGGAVHALVWGRDTSPATAAAFLRKVDADLLITGHIPCDDGYDVPNEHQLILDSMGSPACYCLFPADRPLTHPELVGLVKSL
ncbi:MAG TPA: metallophosphoesterase [Gemmataceae bacterium]|nr:metallophosphoesterase [Gemmataceae bacterium]